MNIVYLNWKIKSIKNQLLGKETKMFSNFQLKADLKSLEIQKSNLI